MVTWPQPGLIAPFKINNKMQTITQKIVSYKVLKPEDKLAAIEAAKPTLEVMHEKMKRPDVLVGSTYKIKNPQSDHAMYITVNDVVLNVGTEHESRVPFEIFVNSKNMEHFQWVTALTRVMSAVFRKGGDVVFLVEELQAVFDPKGGYFKKGKFMPSLVAEIGSAIESHLISIGMIKPVELDDTQKQFLATKRAEFDALHGDNVKDDESPVFPEKATLCQKCNVKAVVVLDNCATCLNCLESKCG